MSRDVQADDNLPEGYDPSTAGRFAIKANDVWEMMKVAAEEWASFRKAPSKDTLATFFSYLVIGLDEFSASTGIATLMGLELMPFRFATAVFEDAQKGAASGMVSSDITGGMAGRVTLAMRDARLAAQQMVKDGRQLRGPEKSTEYMAYCASAAALYNALAMVAKLFRLNMRNVLKAASTITAHSQALSAQALATQPQPGAMMIASWVRRATIECRRNPTTAIAMVEGLLKSLQGS